MTTTIAVTLWLLIIAALYIPGLIQRRRAKWNRLSMRAATAIIAARTAEQERDEALELLDGERSKNRALSAANDRLYQCLRDRMDEVEYAALQQGVTVYDRTLADFEAWERSL